MMNLENQKLRELIKHHCDLLIRNHCYFDFVDRLIDEYESLYFSYVRSGDDDSRSLVSDMLEALYFVFKHGEIITLSISTDDTPSPDLVRVVYADGFVSDERTTLTYFFDKSNPDFTLVNSELRIL